MKQKNLLISMAAACFLLFLAGCGSGSKGPSMYIDTAQLTKEEKNIADLLGLDTEHYIFDFVLDDSIQTIQINTYLLNKDRWDLIAGGGGHAFSDTEGRLALRFDNIGQGLRTALQGDTTEGATSYTSQPTDSFEGMSCATSFLSDQTEIAYEQEIPLAIQIVTSKDEIHSYLVEYFHTPEEYAKYEYEYVYAITVRFSQKTVNELSIDP